jgi:hypothetical protein
MINKNLKPNFSENCIPNLRKKLFISKTPRP